MLSDATRLVLVTPPRPTNYEAVSIVLTAPRFFRYIFIVREIDDGKMKDVVLRGTPDDSSNDRARREGEKKSTNSPKTTNTYC